MGNKIRVGRVKPYNSSFILTLYAHFDNTGKFLYFQYGETISDCVYKILDEKASVFDCDKAQLYKIERLK